MRKVYLICPVRNSTMNFLPLVEELEKSGNKIHFPPRDVDQTKESKDICREHANAINKCDEVWIIWDNESKGSHFDLGMAYALNKPVKLLAVVEMPTTRKNYLAVIMDLELNGVDKS